MIEKKTIADINQYCGSTINPMENPDTKYELYSVPSFENQYPEIVEGKKIGSSKVTVEDGDVLICKINPRINRVWVVKHHTSNQLLASSEWIVIRNRQLNAQYLKWYFSSPKFRELLISQVAGIGGSLTRAQPKQVAKYPVPILPLNEQRKIAVVLDKVSDLIAKRRQQLDKLDELVKAKFVEMFGTLHDSKNMFPVVSIEDVCSLIKDGTHQTPQYTDDVKHGFKFLSSKDVMTQRLSWENIKYIPAELHDKLYAVLQPKRNDILMSKNGVNYGIAAVNDTDGIFDIYVSLALLRPTEKINPVYLRCVINNPDTKQQFDRSIKGIGVPNLHLSEIKKTRILLPPIDMQNQFSAFVEQTEKTRTTISRSLEKLETLKKALMQEYFG